MADDLSANLDELPGGDRTPASKPPAERSVAKPRPSSGGASGFRTRHGKKSIAQHVFELLSEEDRPWTPSEMVDEFERRRITVYRPGTRDRTKNVRFQLAEFAKDGRAIRVDDGQYRAKTPQNHSGQSLLPVLAYESPALNGAGSFQTEEGG